MLSTFSPADMASSFPSETDLPGTTPSVGELSASFAKEKRPKSPPLAFEPSPGDALAPLTSPPKDFLIDSLAVSPSMGRHSSQSEDERKLQIIVEKQARLIDSLHETFADERKIWGLERERLHQRIARLEGLLKHGDGHSPAKSPVLSPTSMSNFTSPQSRPVGKLPSIAEDENIIPLSQRRDNAPASIDLSNLPGSTRRKSSGERTGSVNFAPDETPAQIRVEEIPEPAAMPLSPPPFNYRMEAGHTPMQERRPPAPPPKNSLVMDGIEDTPTRNNTHINNCYLTRSRDEDDGGDRELAGPLNLPELPHAPGDTNFSLDMLSQRLQNLSEHPDESDSQPLVFKQKSPGLASPVSETEADTNFSPKTLAV